MIYEVNLVDFKTPVKNKDLMHILKVLLKIMVNISRILKGNNTS